LKLIAEEVKSVDYVRKKYGNQILKVLIK